MISRVAWLLPCCLLMAQCGALQKIGRGGHGNESTLPKMDPERRGWALMMSDEEFERFKKGGSANAAAPGSASTEQATAGAGGGMFDFSSMLPGQGREKSQVIWQRSATLAARQSRLTSMPLLLYVTHRSSKPAQDIERTLMASPAFQSLAQEKFVPLLVDYSDQATTQSTLYRELKSRFEVRGYPALIVTLPNGTEVTRLTGYKTESEKRYLEMLQAAADKAEKLNTERRAKLEKESGYRTWKNKDGKPVFARLTALDANMGTFTGEWGEDFKTFLTRLSEEDQAWIAERRK